MAGPLIVVSIPSIIKKCIYYKKNDLSKNVTHTTVLIISKKKINTYKKNAVDSTVKYKLLLKVMLSIIYTIVKILY